MVVVGAIVVVVVVGAVVVVVVVGEELQPCDNVGAGDEASATDQGPLDKTLYCAEP